MWPADCEGVRRQLKYIVRQLPSTTIAVEASFSCLDPVFQEKHSIDTSSLSALVAMTKRSLLTQASCEEEGEPEEPGV
ncbi:MAG: hypothetical protein MHM6MM_001141 [Cercozoa sp. M6MM]